MNQTIIPFKSLFYIGLLALAFWGAGCKRSTQVDATRPLSQSFATAEPETKRTIETVTTSLKSRNYAEATKVLAPLVDGRRMTQPQREAVGLALKQINDAVSANPALDTKEMFELRQRMYKAVDSGPRF